MPTTVDYESLFAECVAEMERPLPLNCAQRGWEQSRECKMCGGCPKCYAELLGKIVITDSAIISDEMRRKVEIAAYRRGL